MNQPSQKHFRMEKFVFSQFRFDLGETCLLALMGVWSWFFWQDCVSQCQSYEKFLFIFYESHDILMMQKAAMKEREWLILPHFYEWAKNFSIKFPFLIFCGLLPPLTLTLVSLMLGSITFLVIFNVEDLLVWAICRMKTISYPLSHVLFSYRHVVQKSDDGILKRLGLVIQIMFYPVLKLLNKARQMLILSHVFILVTIYNS